MTIDYLVGGLRISLGPATTTPGPTGHIEHVVSEMRSLGHHVNIFMSSESRLLRPLTRLGEGTVKNGNHSTFANLKGLLSDALRVVAGVYSGARLARWSAKTGANIVYERASVMNSLIRFHTDARKRRATIVVESNGIFSRETKHDRSAIVLESLAAYLEQRTYHMADKIVVVSAALGREVVSFSGVQSQKIIVCPNGIPRELSTRSLPPARRRVIGFAGSVVEWQSLDKLLRAFALSIESEIVSSLRHWQIEIIGDGPEVDPLRTLSTELAIGTRLTFLPRLSRAELYDRMEDWGIGVALHRASSSEAMYHSPLKLYEYAGLDIPVLCTASSDAMHLQSSGARMAIVPNTVEEIARGLAELVQIDNLLSSNAKRREILVQEHSWNSRVDYLIRQIES